jgi:hypothetical protein
MANLLAATTLHVELVLVGYPSAVVFIFFVLVLFLMFTELAASGLFLGLSTTPPHFAGKLALMGGAAPVEILLFKEVFATLLTDLGAFIEFAAAGLELLYAINHFLAFGD